MKQIKFRAWDTKHKKMFDNVSTGTIHIWGDNSEQALADECEFMQFTGLTDKNGKEIYEGDILGNGKVVWNQIDCGFNYGGRK